MGNVVNITSKPRAEASRKGANRTTAEQKELMASNAPALIECVQLDIVAKWRRGVKIAWLAKIHQLTTAQVEATIWVHLHGAPMPPAALRRAA